MPLPVRPGRRTALRALFTVSVLGGAAGALAPLLAHRARTGRPVREAPALERFAEMYRGRLIEGGTAVLVPAGAASGGAAPGPPGAEVRIDGRPLPVLRRADGSYLSTVHHYESFPTLHALARAAVDELGPGQLARVPPGGHGH
ncbi:tyrosinase family oxidase copper chaperone [Streptomyces yaizuensis]|uniref:Tyrosinase co-factor protein n=1 Tax=Streptomyces yaizuensis TaxID=2989713 RepID=A0ABQ5NVG4_9ACTN|nr:tyrosinase family oxidase copper chaperone [Streptomyces sp. YSPA8]GLF94360.1 tyrosinase co-factor protein [Streptomyces sp. YSPA8]